MADTGKGNIIPTMRYRDGAAAIEWLCDAFGFERHSVFPNPDGSIGHSELKLGNGMIMVASIQDTPFSRYLKQPRDVGGFVTQSTYIVVPDADAHCAKAKAAGAEILLDIKTQDYGGRDYTCRDPEGHIWSFGTYDPWKAA
jgi:uncharacterized glyoxalase superfamily protein PhnB